jgi:predicted P-loop ATPase
MSFYKLTAPEWHNEITSSPTDKDFFMMMKGKMIVEFSEGETHDRASSKLMKSVITRSIDTYRNPYGYFTNDNYRRCVFAMSVNDLKYLRDESGNRRYLPVKCGTSINIDWIVENREQLFAEAYYYAITLGENIYDGLNTEEIKEMQEMRRQERFEETRIIDWYEDRTKEEREEGFTLEEIFVKAVAGEGDKFNQLHNNIIPPILTHVLKLERVRKTKDGKKKALYVPTPATYKKFPLAEVDINFNPPEIF